MNQKKSRAWSTILDTFEVSPKLLCYNDFSNNMLVVH